MTQCAIDILLGQEVNMATVENHDSLWRDIKTATLILYENMDTEKPKLEMMPSYFGHGLTSELVGAEVAYGLGRSVCIKSLFNLLYGVIQTSSPFCCPFNTLLLASFIPIYIFNKILFLLSC